MQRAGITRLTGVVMGLDVREASCQEYAIDLAEDIFNPEMIRHHRNDQRQSIGAINQRLEIVPH